jgi:hypothetical protein
MTKLFIKVYIRGFATMDSLFYSPVINAFNQLPSTP